MLSAVPLTPLFFPHVFSHFFLLKIVDLSKNNNRLHWCQSLLCDAVDGHLVKVTSHFRLSDEAISGRHQGLFCPNLLSAGNLIGLPKNPTKKWERRWESWVQCLQVTPTVLDDACNIVQSQLLVLSSQTCYEGNLDTPPANIPWVSPAFHSGPSRFRLKEYWIADSEFKVKHAIKTCGNSASPLDVQALLSWQGEKTRNNDDKDKLQRAGIWDQTNYKTKWAETPLSSSDFQEPLRRLQNLANMSNTSQEIKPATQNGLTGCPKLARCGTRVFPSRLTSVTKFHQPVSHVPHLQESSCTSLMDFNFSSYFLHWFRFQGSHAPSLIAMFLLLAFPFTTQLLCCSICRQKYTSVAQQKYSEMISMGDGTRGFQKNNFGDFSLASRSCSLIKMSSWFSSSTYVGCAAVGRL